MEVNKSNININTHTYKEYIIKTENTMYNLRIEIIKEDIYINAKELNDTLDYNYKNKINLMSLINNLKLDNTNNVDFTNNDLFFTKFDDLYKNNKFCINNIDNNNNINLLIINKNSKYIINLYKNNMNIEDKINILFNHIKLLQKSNQTNHDSNLVNSNSKINDLKLVINKKEDDLKNIINEKDLEIEKLKDKLIDQENIIKNNTLKIKEIQNELCTFKNDIKTNIENLKDSNNKQIKDLKKYFKKKYRKIKNELNASKILNDKNNDKSKIKRIDLNYVSSNYYSNDNILIFKCIPIKQFSDFLNTFKNNLSKFIKINDKKLVQIKIKSSGEFTKYGTIIKFLSINKFNYYNYIDFDYSKYFNEKALSVFNITLNCKSNIFFNDKEKNKLEKMISHFVPDFISKLFGLNLENYKIFLRLNENNISIDATITNGILKQFLDIGLILSEFYEFKASFKSVFSPENIFSLSNEDLLLNMLKFIISVKGSFQSIKYILSVFIESLKVLKLSNEKNQSTLEQIIHILNLIYSFLSVEMNFEFDQNEIVKSFLSNINIKQYLGNNIKSLYEGSIKPFLNSYGIYNIFKSIMISFNKISINLIFPQYKSGVSFSLKIPEFAKIAQYLSDNEKKENNQEKEEKKENKGEAEERIEEVEEEEEGEDVEDEEDDAIEY